MDTLDSSKLPIADKMPDLTSFMPDYLTHFGLRSDPFAVTDFYQGAGRQSFLDNLHHQVLFGAGLLVVGAAQGVGKTRLSAQLQKSFADIPANVCSMCLKEGVTLQSFIAELALMLGMSSLAAVPLGQALSELRRCLQARREDGSLSVLLIDDAHHLDDESLATLVGLLQGQAELDRSVCVVLFAEPNFLGRLAVTDIGDLLLHDILLEAFDLNELRAYLQWRFSLVDENRDFPFKDSDLESWLLESAGNLACIHKRAQQWLLESVSVAGVDGSLPAAQSSIASGHTADDLKRLPLLHIGAIVLLSSVLLSAYLFRGDSDDLVVPIETTSKSVIGGEGEEPQVTVAKEYVDSLPGEAGVAIAEADVDGAGASEVLLDLRATAERKLPVQTIETVLAKKTPVVEKSPEVIIPAAKLREPKAALKSEPKKVAPLVEKEPAGLTFDEKALLALKKQQYLLQIMAASSRSSVEAFVAKQPNRKKLYIFSSKRQGADWYVVVSGAYESIDIARAAINRLPSSQREAGPWPRSVADVQLKIQENSRI